MIIPDFYIWTTGLGSAILPCPYVEISANHTGLSSAIFPCSYVEIRDNHTGLGSAIFHGQCVDISANHTGLVLAIRLTLISAYGQERMAETRHI
jgi:hypothetical protein